MSKQLLIPLVLSRRFSLLVLLVGLCCAVRAPAQVGPWSPHSSMRAVGSIAASNESIFAGTSGGIFVLDKGSRDISTFTVVDGLHSVVVRTIAVDAARNNLWIGYPDGVLDRLDVDDGTIDNFRDISRATQFSSRQVNRIAARGDSLLVATGFGLVIVDLVRDEIRDSYTRFGAFNPAIDVRDVDIVSGPAGSSIWVATAEGVAHAAFGGTNLQDPSLWSNDRFSGDGILAIRAYEGDIYVGTESGLFMRMIDSTYQRVGTSTERINSLSVGGGRLYASGQFNVYVLDGNGYRVQRSEIVSAPTGVVPDIVDGTLWIGDAAAGVVEAGPVDDQSTELPVTGSVFPAGPLDGLFTEVSVAPDGTLLAAGVPGPGRGFYARSTDGVWTSYVLALYPELGNQASFLIADIDESGTFWTGSVGGGVVSVETDGVITNYRSNNSSLESVSTVSDFYIVGGIDSDASNSVWVTTVGSTVPLHVRDKEGEWTALQPYIGQGLTARSTAYGKITIDSYGQKWIIVRDESSIINTRGLMVLNTRNTPTDQSDDSFRFFGSSGGGGQGLPSNVVTDVVEDRDGLLWIGTDEGLAYFVNNGIIADDSNSIPIWPQRADRTEGVFLLFGLQVNTLAVDPANRIWIGTDEGIRIVQSVEGGFEEVLTLSTENSPLPSNRVIDIAIHPSSGEVYVVTDAGMVSTRGEAVEPAVSVRDLFVYPNPLDLRDGTANGVYVEGLVDGTVVSIVGPTGNLIRRIEGRGGRVQWDGRNEAGEFARSGVYLVVAVGQNGEGTGYGKVAVIR